jgi:hypothetical protein
MKKIFSFLLLLITTVASLYAQTDNSVKNESDNAKTNANANDEFTYGEFKAGYGVTQFSTGLKERFNNGNFSTSSGGLFSIAAYRKFQKINHLHFGLKFKALGAGVSRGNNNNEMFFNFWGTGISTKYFPFSKSGSQGFYFQGDYNFTTQFTQKYRNTTMLEFDHQFAIGNSFTLGMGYQIKLKKRYGLIASVEYDNASRQGEVQTIGSKNFRNSNIGFQIGLIF